VGTAMLQLGRLLDLEMYGTASKPEHELVAGLGATPIDYRSEGFSERMRELTADGVDAAFDPISGGNRRRSFKSLKRGGALVAYGSYDNAMGKRGNTPSSSCGSSCGESCPTAAPQPSTLSARRDQKARPRCPPDPQELPIENSDLCQPGKES